jgi:hypothetical protein
VIRGATGFGAGQALVREQPTPPWLRNIKDQRSGDVYADVENHYVMPGGGQANDIEGDPSPFWEGKPYGFNNNGEFALVATHGALGTITSRSLQGFGDAAASTGVTSIPPIRMTANVVSSIGPTVTAALGAGFGAYLAPQHRAAGTLVGAVVGGILGLIFSP